MWQPVIFNPLLTQYALTVGIAISKTS